MARTASMKDLSSLKAEIWMYFGFQKHEDSEELDISKVCRCAKWRRNTVEIPQVSKTN